MGRGQFWDGSEDFGGVLPHWHCVTFSVAWPLLPLLSSSSPFLCLLIYSLDCHMAAIPALNSACHHALTLIGLICYSFPSGLGRILGTWCLDVSRQDFQPSLIYQDAKISQKDNSNLFDNRQVWCGGKLNIKYSSVFVRRVSKAERWQQSEMMLGKTKQNRAHNCPLICCKNTHNTLHAKKTNHPTGHPLPASPTAPLNVRKVCSGECRNKGQPMVMPKLTLCFVAQSRRTWNPTDRSLTFTDLPFSTTATVTSNIHHTPNSGTFYKGAHPHGGFLFFPPSQHSDYLYQKRHEYTWQSVRSRQGPSSR